ncbi:MAG: putative nicotinate-nucleotide adenylyltransferase (NadD-like) [Rhodospirillaceae bacterium]|nr:MAG: putative nicotinate-nucleotide adenylyltransferase (NadD-like) [Rhodospirillaceae bacterium]
MPMWRRTVGLLGGSFNPAHGGHVHISQMAIRALGISEVWWLVSPQNPLKPIMGMAPMAERLARAQAVAATDPRLFVSDLEARLGTRYTVDTVDRLRRRYRRCRFIWLMGADNLAQVSQWRRWPRLFHMVPVAVLARWPYSLKALAGAAARRFVHERVSPKKARILAGRKAPAWVFLPIRPHPESATRIRATATLWWEGACLSQRKSPVHACDMHHSLSATLPTSLANDKAEDIIVVDLNGKTSIADYMVIATGRSSRQVGAMAEHLMERLKAQGVVVSLEGMRECDWVLLDAGDVVVHLFRPEVRMFYNLEKMWGGPEITGQGAI